MAACADRDDGLSELQMLDLPPQAEGLAWVTAWQ